MFVQFVLQQIFVQFPVHLLQYCFHLEKRVAVATSALETAFIPQNGQTTPRTNSGRRKWRAFGIRQAKGEGHPSLPPIQVFLAGPVNANDAVLMNTHAYVLQKRSIRRCPAGLSMGEIALTSVSFPWYCAVYLFIRLEADHLVRKEEP
jgi:hypothetical protein